MRVFLSSPLKNQFLEASQGSENGPYRIPSPSSLQDPPAKVVVELVIGPQGNWILSLYRKASASRVHTVDQCQFSPSGHCSSLVLEYTFLFMMQWLQDLGEGFITIPFFLPFLHPPSIFFCPESSMTGHQDNEFWSASARRLSSKQTHLVHQRSHLVCFWKVLQGLTVTLSFNPRTPDFVATS